MKDDPFCISCRVQERQLHEEYIKRPLSGFQREDTGVFAVHSIDSGGKRQSTFSLYCSLRFVCNTVGLGNDNMYHVCSITKSLGSIAYPVEHSDEVGLGHSVIRLYTINKIVDHEL